MTYRKFCQLGWGQVVSKSGLASCIKAIQQQTLEQINRLLVGIAENKKITAKESAWIRRWWSRTFIRRSIRISFGTVCAGGVLRVAYAACLPPPQRSG